MEKPIAKGLASRIVLTENAQMVRITNAFAIWDTRDRIAAWIVVAMAILHAKFPDPENATAAGTTRPVNFASIALKGLMGMQLIRIPGAKRAFVTDMKIKRREFATLQLEDAIVKIILRVPIVRNAKVDFLAIRKTVGGVSINAQQRE